ncbi:MAG: hypothetical protein HQK84_10590 [Nitrospinae bacterium]|nr:hypothetical protein [Nitrospinota bacterium]
MKKTTFCRWLAPFILSFACLFLFSGCDGSETKETINESVEGFTGKKAMDQGNKMKKELEEINKIQQQRNQKLNN